jgi:hypothetical protein
MAYTLAFPGKGDRELVQVKPPVEEDSPSTDSDDIASVEDSVEPGTTCKKEALAGDDDAEIDSEEKTLIFNP